MCGGHTHKGLGKTFRVKVNAIRIGAKWHNQGHSFRTFFFLSLLIYFERKSENKRGRGREKGKERIPSRLHAVSIEPKAGLELTNCEIMT